MKKILFLVLLFGGLTPSVFATNSTLLNRKSTPGKVLLYEDLFGWSLPSTGAKWPFATNSIWFNINTSIGIIGYPSFGNTRAFWPLHLSGEYGLTPHVGIGPYLGFYRITYTDVEQGISYKSRLSSYSFGARGLLHITDVINQQMGADIDVKEWDIYGGLFIGLVSNTWSVDEGFTTARSEYDVSIYPSVGLILGAKYLITPVFGINAEIGKGNYGLISFGISGSIK
ncbi:MAG TPA: hypothetical protein PK509_16710 [Catalimonadaceae bacterium]|nr:hypothetical protein [Catalimonadaceae bacterium]HPI10478.1 hypothetical protein [Catalimonadaceae bacterium]